MVAIATYDGISILSREDGSLLSRMRALTRANLRWSVDGRHILSFRWTAGQDDDFIAFPVTDGGRLEPPRLLASLVPTLLRGEFDVARGTGRVVIGSGSEFHDIWSFDLAGTPVQARRLTQGTNWYGPPFLTADGRSLYYLRADPLGNSLYRVVDGVETALTAERQIVNNSLRLTRDDRVVTFESRFDSVHVLVVYDIAAGTSRRVPRAPDEFGWLLPGHEELVWVAPFERSLFLTDSRGGNRRQVDVGPPAVRNRVLTGWSESEGSWNLGPDGESVAIIGGDRDVATVYRVPLRGGTAAELANFPRSEGPVGLAGWGRDGVIHLARRDRSSGGTLLLRIDAASGALRGSIVLPAACTPGGVSVATFGRRAACEVTERRADLMILDGIRP